MPAWTGPLYVAAVLLVVAAAPKLRRPEDTARALRSTGLPGSDALVRVLAVVELVVGVAALLTGSRLSALLVAASYAAFTGFVVLARQRDGVVSSCGCFGTPDTPPTRSHIVVTGLLALGAAGAVIAPSAPVWRLTDDPGSGVALLLLTAVAAGLAYLALAVLPTLALAASPPSTESR